MGRGGPNPLLHRSRSGMNFDRHLYETGGREVGRGKERFALAKCVMEVQGCSDSSRGSIQMFKSTIFSFSTLNFFFFFMVLQNLRLSKVTR